MYKKWDDWYKMALEYAKTHNGSIASMRADYVTSDGYELGPWLQVQKRAYNYRNIPKEERKYSLEPLTDEQVMKLEALEMIWSFRGNEIVVKNMCIGHFTLEEYRKNKQILIRIPARIFKAKLNYCISNNIPLIVENKINRFFTISSVNLETEYGITLEELLRKFGTEKELKNVLS